MRLKTYLAAGTEKRQPRPGRAEGEQETLGQGAQMELFRQTGSSIQIKGSFPWKPWYLAYLKKLEGGAPWACVPALRSGRGTPLPATKDSAAPPLAHHAGRAAAVTASKRLQFNVISAITRSYTHGSVWPREIQTKFDSMFPGLFARTESAWSVDETWLAARNLLGLQPWKTLF